MRFIIEERDRRLDAAIWIAFQNCVLISPLKLLLECLFIRGLNRVVVPRVQRVPSGVVLMHSKLVLVVRNCIGAIRSVFFINKHVILAAVLFTSLLCRDVEGADRSGRLTCCL